MAWVLPETNRDLNPELQEESRKRGKSRFSAKNLTQTFEDANQRVTALSEKERAHAQKQFFFSPAAAQLDEVSSKQEWRFSHLGPMAMPSFPISAMSGSVPTVDGSYSQPHLLHANAKGFYLMLAGNKSQLGGALHPGRHGGVASKCHGLPSTGLLTPWRSGRHRARGVQTRPARGDHNTRPRPDTQTPDGRPKSRPGNRPRPRRARPNSDTRACHITSVVLIPTS